MCFYFLNKETHETNSYWWAKEGEIKIILVYILYIYIYIYICWPTVVKGDPNAPFSIAPTLRCRGGHYSFPWFTLLTLDPYLITLSLKQGGIKYHVLSRPRIEPRSPGPLANTLTILPMGIYIYIYRERESEREYIKSQKLSTLVTLTGSSG